MSISERGDGYIIVEDYITDEEISEIWKATAIKKYEYGKVGSGVNKQKKLRKDCFFYRDECKFLDTIFFTKGAPHVRDVFDISLCFRERWKIGHYSGEERGFYIPHTDIQGEDEMMHYRKISIVVALSNPEDYEGGELVFPEQKKSFRLKRGSAILFRSSILHGVNPVTKGDRYVLISFTFDHEGSVKKLKFASSLADYIPKCDSSLLLEKPYLNMKEAISVLKEPHLSELEKYKEELARKVSVEATELTGAIDTEDGIRVTIQPRLTATTITATDKYLLPILPDSGPGNQIVGIKEALIMSHYTGRICILPPICQHYIKTPHFWQFEEIYKYTGDDAILYRDIQDDISSVNTAYCIHANFFKKELKLQKYLNLELDDERMVSKRRYRQATDYKEIADISNQRILCIKHIFNNTCISPCGFNGCNDCRISKSLEPIYAKICGEFDFSDRIHGFAREFITKKLGDSFIAIHMRYPDVMGGKKLKDYAGYDEGNIRDALVKFKELHGIPHAKIFIATNNQKAVASSPLKEFVIYTNDTGSPSSTSSRFIKRHTPDIDSFVEQCICSESRFFIMSKYNDYSKKDEPHQRSTWSSFIKDYRQYHKMIPESDHYSRCVLITDILKLL